MRILNSNTSTHFYKVPGAISKSLNIDNETLLFSVTLVIKINRGIKISFNKINKYILFLH